MSHNKQILDSFTNRNRKLSARYFPSERVGPPLILLHGLLGSSRNWLSAARILAEGRPVWAVDLPDHGTSAWSENPGFAEMVLRLCEWMEQEKLEQADWLGHSMGGKVALRMAVEHAERVRKLVLADIFPRIYEPHHRKDLKAMLKLPLDKVASRKDADRHLEAEVADWALRQFLLTNLVTDPETKRFRWQINVRGLYENLPFLAGLSAPPSFFIPHPTLLLHGGKSTFVRPEDLEKMGNHFQSYSVACLPEAGHNLHVEDREGFTRVVEQFLGT